MDKKYEDYDEVAMLFQRVFKTEDGKDVLSILKRRFHDPAILPSAAVDGVALGKLTDVRIGEFNFYRFLDAMVNKEIGKKHETTNKGE